MTMTLKMFPKIVLLCMLAALPLTKANATSPLLKLTPYLVLDASFINIPKPMNLVIRNQAQWVVFYKKATASVYPKPPMPYVDFTRQQVVVMITGAPTGGHSMLTSNVIDIAGMVSVSAVLIKPGAGCFVTQAVTYPATMFVMPKINKPFKFYIQQDVYRKCK